LRQGYTWLVINLCGAGVRAAEYLAAPANLLFGRRLTHSCQPAANNTAYAVGLAGGLPPPEEFSFWPLSATNVADSGQKE
jgi:hypothetical protein